MKKHIAQYVNNFVPISERILLIQLEASPVNITIVQVYAPTAEKSEDIIEQFYDSLETTINNIRKEEVLIIMGDFNAKIGKGRSGEFVGPFGLGERNERGERLDIFCNENNLVVMNTFFKLPARRLYTWKSPLETPDHIIRNQIDYILVNRRFRNCFKSGADVKSDHVPLVGNISKSEAKKGKEEKRQKTNRYN